MFADRGHEACRFRGAAALPALQPVAHGRLEPTLAARGYDAWRTTGPGPWRDQLDALLAAMPPEAHARAFSHSCLDSGPSTSDPGPLLSAYLDAMTDCLPRSPGAVVVTGRAAFANRAAQHVPHLPSAGRLAHRRRAAARRVLLLSWLTTSGPGGGATRHASPAGQGVRPTVRAPRLRGPRPAR